MLPSALTAQAVVTRSRTSAARAARREATGLLERIKRFDRGVGRRQVTGRADLDGVAAGGRRIHGGAHAVDADELPDEGAFERSVNLVLRIAVRIWIRAPAVEMDADVHRLAAVADV